MDVKYRMLIDLTIEQEFQGVENLKSNSEMAQDVCHLIADEVATAGGVCKYDVVRSEIAINNELKGNTDFILDRFLRLY